MLHKFCANSHFVKYSLNSVDIRFQARRMAKFQVIVRYDFVKIDRILQTDLLFQSSFSEWNFFSREIAEQIRTPPECFKIRDWFRADVIITSIMHKAVTLVSIYSFCIFQQM